MFKEIVFTVETVKDSSLTCFLKITDDGVEVSELVIGESESSDKIIQLDYLTKSKINQLFKSLQTLTIYDDYSSSKNKYILTLTSDDYSMQYEGEAFDVMYDKIIRVLNNTIVNLKEMIKAL